jgi:hypothetical protein
MPVFKPSEEEYIRQTREKQERAKLRAQAQKIYLESNVASGISVKPSIGYHPNNERMKIVQERTGTTLFCHYDPTEFVEKYTSEWEKPPISGTASQPIVFKYIRAREWSMKLLFNDLGEDSSRRSEGMLSTEASLSMLRRWFLPQYAGGFGTSSKVGADRPASLFVMLTNQVFHCCLTDLSIVRKAIMPVVPRFTTRAEVSVVFTEYTAGNIAY